MGPFSALHSRDYDPTADRGGALLAVVIVFSVLTWITVALRFYVRVRISHSVGPDDWIMLAALLVFTAYNGLDIAGVHYGTGRHAVELTFYQIETALELWLFAEMLYITCSTVARVSVAVFLLRVTINRTQRWILTGTTIFTVLFNFALFFYTLFQCRPVSYFWTRYSTFDGYCINIETSVIVTYVASGVNAIADVVYALIPVAMLWSAQLSRKQKVTVAGILSLGALAGVAVCIRIPYVKNFKDGTDFLWGSLELAVWSAVEPGIGITAGSLATLRPLVRKFQFIWSSRRDANSPNTTTRSSRGWKKSKGTDAQQPWSSDNTLTGVAGDLSNSTVRDGAMSRDGLRMNPSSPQSLEFEGEVFRLQSVEQKRSRGLSNLTIEGDDYYLGRSWEQSSTLNSPTSTMKREGLGI